MTAIILFITILFFILAVNQYEMAVIVVAGLLPLYLLKTNVLGQGANALEILISILVVVGVLQTGARQHFLRVLKKIPPQFIIASQLFLGAAILSTGISPYLHNSLGVLKGWIIIPMVYAFIVLAYKDRPHFVSNIIRALISSGVIVSLLGLLQIGTMVRIKSIYDVPNSLALFIAPLLVLSVWKYIETKQKFFMVALVCMAPALLFTQSLMGVVAVLIALLIGFIFYLPAGLPRKKWLSAFLVVAFLIVGMFWQNGKISYLMSSISNSGTSTSLTVRLQLWSISQELIKEHPFLGIGLNQFEPNYQQKLHQRFSLYFLQATTYKLPPSAEFVFRDPHNFLLSFWLNMGLLGLVSFIVLNYLALSFIWKKEPDTQKQALALALIAMLCFGLADTIYWKNDLATLWWVLIVLLLSNYR